jgi:hypothetical protein
MPTSGWRCGFLIARRDPLRSVAHSLQLSVYRFHPCRMSLQHWREDNLSRKERMKYVKNLLRDVTRLSEAVTNGRDCMERSSVRCNAGWINTQCFRSRAVAD